MLLAHGYTFGVHEEYEGTTQFPEGTTRTLLYSRGRATNHYCIMLPDMLELREVLDDEGTGKSWLLLALNQEPMQDTNVTRVSLQEKAG